jgi:hypothetical protein
MYTKEELLAIHFTLEKLIITEFQHQIKPEQIQEVRDRVVQRIYEENLRHPKENKSMSGWLNELILQEISEN